MFDKDTPKVADFGIAVLGGAAGELSTHTESSMGTIGYVAPEQQYRLKVDERADQYSLAAITYELLTGQKPLGVFEPPSRLNRTLGTSVDAVVMRALSEDRDDRYPTIQEFGNALDRALTGSRGRARGLRRLAMGGALMAAVAGIAVASRGRSRPAPTRSPEHPPLARPIPHAAAPAARPRNEW